MSERNDQLKGLIQNGQADRAIKMVRSAEDYNEGETFVFTVLCEEKSTLELVEEALETFLGTRKNRHMQHGYWVHNLSHFTEILWERRMYGWIKKFNEVAFKGANELHDSCCCERLVGDFDRYAKFNDDPANFALTPENLRWMDWKQYEYQYEQAKARVEAGRFKSEEDRLRWTSRWQLRRPEIFADFDYEVQTYLVNINAIRSLIQKLQELGEDTSEFTGLERDLLTKRLNELENELTTTVDWKRERLGKAIEKTRAALT